MDGVSLYDRLSSGYKRYHAAFDFLFYASVVLLAATALIRDCELTLWGFVLLNPFSLHFIYILDVVIIPVLALVTLIFGYNEDSKKKILIFFFLALIWSFQLNKDLTFLETFHSYILSIVSPDSMDRKLWIYSNTSIYRLGIACLVVAAKGRSFRKAAWAFVISQTILMLVITALSLTGVIPDLVFAEVGRPGRHALGLHYPLNYVAHWFSISLVYCYLRNGRLKVLEYLGLVSLLVVSLFVCKAQTSSVLFFILIVGTFIRQMGWGRKHWRREFILKCLKYSFLFFAAFMILASLLYIPPISTAMGKISSLNTFFSRFAFGRVGLMEYFPSLLGVDYPISTWTGTVANEDYFFIDCSYIYELLHCGILVFPVMMALLWYIPHRLYERRQGYALCILALFACICAMEHHLADASFNIFWLMVFADLDGEAQSNAVTALSSSSKSTS